MLFLFNTTAKNVPCSISMQSIFIHAFTALFGHAILFIKFIRQIIKIGRYRDTALLFNIGVKNLFKSLLQHTTKFRSHFCNRRIYLAIQGYRSFNAISMDSVFFYWNLSFYTSILQVIECNWNFSHWVYSNTVVVSFCMHGTNRQVWTLWKFVRIITNSGNPYCKTSQNSFFLHCRFSPVSKLRFQQVICIWLSRGVLWSIGFFNNKAAT